ncbi:MAG: aminodeoxychorismate lyase [Steroidobacteraceae bacterium]
MNSPATLVDGLAASTVSVNDRGLQYGDGLFETMTCVHGRVRWLERHLARLQLGCEQLGIAMPDAAALRQEMAVLAGGRERCLLKLIVTRGQAVGRGYRPTGTERATRILSRHEWPAAPGSEFRLQLSPVKLGRNVALAGIKHLNRLEQVLAQRVAGQAGDDEALQCCESGEVICGTMSNVFVVNGDEWLTPGITACGVAGVMRSLVLAIAPTLAIAVREVKLMPADLLQAPAIVVSNVRLGLQAVHWYEGRRLAAPTSLARVWEAIDAAAF